jgi:hypothetical protein
MITILCKRRMSFFCFCGGRTFPYRFQYRGLFADYPGQLLLGQHVGPHVCEIGKRFRGGRNVLDLDAVDFQPQHRSERRHAMVRIGFHFSRLEIHCRHWRDLQPVGKLTGISPDSGDLVNQCFQAVRLMATQMMRVGVSAKTRIAANDGAISPAAVRSKSPRPLTWPSPVTSQYRTPSITGKLISAPIRSKYPGSRPPGCVVDSGQ